MPSRSGPLLAAALVVALLALAGCAQQSGSEPAASDVETTAQEAPPVEEIAPHEMTCAEIKETLDAKESEEEASYLALWAYGVRTGAKGLDFEKYPVTQAGLEDFITRVVLACKADPDKLYVDAILE